MKDVSLIVFDFDGVMTDNRVRVHQSGEEAVWCHRGDGWGIARLTEAGFQVLVLSTETNPVVAARCHKLKIEAFQGCDDKLSALRQLARARNLAPEQVAYVGNDLLDVTPDGSSVLLRSGGSRTGRGSRWNVSDLRPARVRDHGPPACGRFPSSPCG